MMQSEIVDATLSNEPSFQDDIAVFRGEFSEADQLMLREAALVGFQFDLVRSIPSTLSLFETKERRVIGNITIC